MTGVQTCALPIFPCLLLITGAIPAITVGGHVFIEGAQELYDTLTENKLIPRIPTPRIEWDYPQETQKEQK